MLMLVYRATGVGTINQNSRKRGWQGVWENFARLYSYWATFIINPTFNRPKLGPADATLALQMAQATFQGCLN